MNKTDVITVIGAGLAGSEAALQIAARGLRVRLVEMRPEKKTPAHSTDQFAELVCSNSFGSEALGASRILKDELSALGARVLAFARDHRVPAGASLAVDRIQFSAAVTQAVLEHSGIEICRRECTDIPAEGITIVATGPLTSPALAGSLGQMTGNGGLYFYDAISPIVSADSLDMSKLYWANRYGKGETPDFLNIPLTREQYEELISDLLSGEVVLPHDFEEEKYFEGCMPIEALAARGPKTLAFGPLKPVGLHTPEGKRPHAVIQLRMENQHGTAFNLVGFQTKLKYGEQNRIFRKLPGLENAEFLRLGSMHRNTFLDSPRLLLPTLQLKNVPRVFIAGQLTGTEGYLESSATGWLAGTNAARMALGEAPIVPPTFTMLGSLVRAITDPTKVDFQPINSNMGILPPLQESDYVEAVTQKKVPKEIRNRSHAERSAKSIQGWLRTASLPEGFGHIVDQTGLEIVDRTSSTSIHP